MTTIYFYKVKHIHTGVVKTTFGTSLKEAFFRRKMNPNVWEVVETEELKVEE